MGLSPGDRIDRYEVLELLGAGGMGEVYRARDPKLARMVALKILHVGTGAGTDGPARLLREARAAAALTHSNVLAIYDVGEVHEPEALRGLPYIAMELVVGRTLRTYVGDESVPMEKRIEWLREVAKALGAAHAAGLVHRDVKPENVMIREDGAVKVLDFGIARRSAALVQDAAVTPHATTESASLPTLTGPGQIVGTPFFMAPEQLRGEELDGRADQFAWGVMAYLLLTGVPPWKGGASDSIAIVSQILSATPPLASKVAPQVPVPAAQIIQRALAKRPDQRFESMARLLESFARTPGAAADAYEQPERLATERLGAAWRRGSWPRPSRLAMGLATTLILLAVGITAGGVWRARRSKRQGSGGMGTAAVVAGACSSNRQCVSEHGGEPWHCHSERHVCVELASQDCKVYAEPHDAEADDVVWVGGMFPLTSDLNMVSEMRAADLARKDFAEALTSSPPVSSPLHARPIGLVVCDESPNGDRAAAHLQRDVECPAVMGFRSTTGALSIISGTLIPNRVLSFVTISQAPSLTRIPEPENEPRLVWRSTFNRDDFATPLARLISDVLEPAAKAGHGSDSTPFKVAVVAPQDTLHELVKSLFTALRFNQRSALENGGNFRQFVYTPDGGTGVTPDHVAEDLLSFAPNVIFFTAFSFSTDILPKLEAHWVTPRRPTYLTASGIDPITLSFVGKDASRRHRFFSVTNVTTSMTNAQLVLRYNMAYPDEPVPLGEAPQPSYDAFYALAYAVESLGAGPVSGPAISSAIGQLIPPGTPIDVGPSQIQSGFQLLRRGHKIDLNGSMGRLDFDVATGEAGVDYAIVCPGVDDSGSASATVDSGLVYDARLKILLGTLHCP